MDWRPYRLPGASELARIEGAVARATEKWALDWVGDAAGLALRCAAAHLYQDKNALRQQERGWTRCSCGARQWIAVLMTDQAVAALARRIYPAVRGEDDEIVRSPLVLRTVTQAIEDLGKSFLTLGTEDALDGAPAVDRRPPAPEIWKAGSGALVAEIAVCGAEIITLFGPVLAANIGRARTAAPLKKGNLSGIGNALQGQKMQVCLSAGETELELAVLRTLVVGDVVRLRTRIDEPLHVTDPAGDPLAVAYLGVSDGRRAAQLARA